MNCLKCGRETPSEQVFCEDCLLEMEKHPVKPGTVVLLPKRKDTVAVKKTVKRRVLSLEEQVAILKKRVRILAVLSVLLAALTAGLAYPAVKYLMEDHFKMGQNYTAITTTTTAPTETADAS